MEQETRAFTIAQFCAAHGISRALFYILKKNNEAPALMRVGRRVLISVEAATDWRTRMTEHNELNGQPGIDKTSKALGPRHF